jgi:membrane protease YdiL (CAAX protease family)
MKIKAYARWHPVVAYFCLAFVIAWGGSLLTAGPGFLSGESIELEEEAVQLLGVGLSVLAGPLVASLAMTYLVDGGAGLRDLVRRTARWQVGVRWYAALLIFPVLLLAVSLALAAWVSPELSPIFFAPGIVMGLLAGLIEEVGWMGFVYPLMRSKQNILRAAIALGLLHALWHIVPNFLGSYNALEEYWLPSFAGSFLFITALRILIVWVYENTQSLLLAQLMHASSTGFYAILIPTNVAPANWALFTWVYAVVLAASAVVVVALYGRDLTRHPRTAKPI